MQDSTTEPRTTYEFMKKILIQTGQQQKKEKNNSNNIKEVRKFSQQITLRLPTIKTRTISTRPPFRMDGQ